jgi:4-hydroxy-tetrahydrodipicolinate reductase
MVKVVLIGLGAIGTEILKYLLERNHEILGVVDSDPEKAGRSVAELTGLPLGITVQPTIQSVPLGDAEVAVFSTKSKINETAGDLAFAVTSGVDVVTTSEEMAYPQHANVEAARDMNTLATDKGVTIIGVGVNPGFVMDWVPSVVASASKNPTSIHVVRSVDVSRRRRQLRSKTGVGLNRPRFEREVSEGRLGHVGLAESAHLIALSLGKELEEVKQGVFPVLGAEDYVMGVRQFVEGRAGTCKIRLDLEMSMTSADFDVIEVKGDPDVKLRFEKGVFGDSATVALAVHAVERVGRARPGLITVLDLPISGK